MMLLGAVSTLVIALLMTATLGILLLTGRIWRGTRLPRPLGPEADDALRRHPAGHARHDLPATRALLSRPVMGPDDDPDFINALSLLVRGDNPDAEV